MKIESWNETVDGIQRLLRQTSFRDVGGELGAEPGFRRWTELTAGVRAERQTVFLIGNGASASMASHFAADMAKNGHIRTEVFSDPALFSAVANDLGYDQVFSEPLRRRCRPGDMLVAISSSGRSPNVLVAGQLARESGLHLVTLSAKDADNPLRGLGTLNIYVPADTYGEAETCHAAILHHWMDCMEVKDEETGPAAVRDRAHGGAPEGEALHASPLFDRTRLELKPLAERDHQWDLDRVLELEPVSCTHPELAEVSRRIRAARASDRPVILFMGAHVLRAGVQRYLIDLLDRGLVTCVAGNGACAIHDYELALVGATTESVARYIREGQFGLWRETGELNDLVYRASRERLGLGEAVGAAIVRGSLPHRGLSVFAAAARNRILATVHVGIGCDIVHEHPNCNGGAYGDTSYRDFLRLAAHMERLEGGVVMSFGSAVTAPEVFLKALAMARNVARGEGRAIRDFATLVCDLHRLPETYREEPSRENPLYYYRPWKTMLARSVADGGASFYVQGDHAETIPQLWTELAR
jgi:phosphoheptose isomerase